MFKEIALTFYLCKLFILLDHQQFLIPVKGKTKSSRVLYLLENYYIQPFKAMDPAQLRLYGTLCVLVLLNLNLVILGEERLMTKDDFPLRVSKWIGKKGIPIFVGVFCFFYWGYGLSHYIYAA